MEACLLVSLVIITGVFADSIGPNDKDTNMIMREGESVTLSCSYDTSSNYVRLYWYREFPNTEPQYLLYKGARSYGAEDKTDHQFQSTTSQTSTELIINSVTLSDSALYYCALRVGLDWGSGFSATDTLTFGKPITLTVLPKDVPATRPVVSIMSPLKGEGQDICLAAGFFPQEKTMTLTLEGKGPVSLNTNSAALLKSSKTYYYAGFTEDKIQTCRVDEEEADTAPDTENQDQLPTIPPSCETNASSTSAFMNSDDPKTKSMTLLVTGLRILLAKCVAVNVLMTVKAFLF